MNKIRVWIKKRLSKIIVIDNYCKTCGKKCEVFHVDREWWYNIVGNERELCLRCFYKLITDSDDLLVLTTYSKYLRSEEAIKGGD